MNEFLIEVCVFLLSMPLWLPLVKELWDELRSTLQRCWEGPSEPTQGKQEPRGQQEAAAAGAAHGTWSDRGAVWSRRRIINPSWDTCRAPLKKPGQREAYAPRRPSQMTADARSARRHGKWQGGFGKRGF